MDEEWTRIVTQQIGARLKRALDIDAAAITPLMADSLERLRLAEEGLLSGPPAQEIEPAE